MSVFLAEKFWNKGYTTNILKQIKHYAKDKLCAKELLAYVIDENIASKKSLLKNDFIFSEVLQLPDSLNVLEVYKYKL